MKTTTMRLMVVLAAGMLVGCGEEGAAVNGPDADNGTGGIGGTVGSAGGQAGAAPGTGGAPVAAGGTIGTTFTSADRDMCMAWPVCPADVFSLLTDVGRVRPNTCDAAFDGARLNCGACMRKSTCDQFVGRCLAPLLTTVSSLKGYVSATTPGSCRAILDSNPSVVAGAWILCTGDSASRTEDGEGVNAATVCKNF